MALASIKYSVNCFFPKICLKNGTSNLKTFKLQVAAISGKALRDHNVKRPAPYPYKEKQYNVFRAMLDKTSHRMDENSKVVVVEGPIAAGKSKVAKQLAEDLDMMYFPDVTMDMYYINAYGYDLRQLDSQLPESAQSFDEKKFCENPTHPDAAAFQLRMYGLRFTQYIDALAHLLSTGQGVVIERSPFSDFVFVEAMLNCGFISKTAASVYYEVRKTTLSEILRPHLVIYLDVPVNKVQENVKIRNIDYEKNSKVFSHQYLGLMEKQYKQNYLKDISAHAELLIYDWSEAGEVEVIVEDIERVSFEQPDPHDPKLRDWYFTSESEWRDARLLYAGNKDYLLTYLYMPRLDCPELILDAEDALIKNKVYEKAPGMQYDVGFNADMGDKGILTKW